MKLNLEHLEVFMTLDNTQCQVVNARKQIANIIYSQGAGYGLAGQALAIKMWNGNENTEYTDDEVKIIKELSERTTAPCFFMAINNAIQTASDSPQKE